MLTSNEEPLNPYRVINEINNTLDHENNIVTHDAGAPRDSIVPFYTATTPHSYIGWGKTTHLGFGIPLMIGAKLAHPDKFCLNPCPMPQIKAIPHTPIPSPRPALRAMRFFLQHLSGIGDFPR